MKSREGKFLRELESGPYEYAALRDRGRRGGRLDPVAHDLRFIAPYLPHTPALSSLARPSQSCRTNGGNAKKLTIFNCSTLFSSHVELMIFYSIPSTTLLFTLKYSTAVPYVITTPELVYLLPLPSASSRSTARGA